MGMRAVAFGLTVLLAEWQTLHHLGRVTAGAVDPAERAVIVTRAPVTTAVTLLAVVLGRSRVPAFVAAPEAITSMLSTGHIVPEEVEVASYLVSTIVGLHGAWMEDP